MYKEYRYYVYITTNKYNKVLYTGVTGKLFNRTFQHKDKIFKNSFTAKYNADKLVYYEIYDDVNKAIAREKQIKGWLRKKKIVLIESINTEWKDLLDEML